jgi:hypothetical protein
MREFKSDGMAWYGDLPECTYCLRNIDEVDSLHETPFSGELCCEHKICRSDLLDNILYNEVIEKKV